MPTVAWDGRGYGGQQDESDGLSYRVPPALRELRNPNQTAVPGAAMPEDPIFDGPTGQDANSKQEKPRLTIRQLRQAAQKESLAKEAAKVAQTPQEAQSKPKLPPPKKKPSLFGGLFQVREPTQVALNQVAAQMIAQHGSTSATKVPNVRLEKMPDCVPKVNSRWDGIPESAKQKERKEEDKSLRGSGFFTEWKSRSEDGNDSRRTNSRNSSSTTGSSLGVFGNSSGSQGTSPRTRFYAQSVNSSGDLASQQRTDASTFSHSLTSPSTVSPEGSLSEDHSHSQRGLSSAGTDYSRSWVAHDLQPPKTSGTDRSYLARPKSTKSHVINRSPLKPSTTSRTIDEQTRARSTRSAVDSTVNAISWDSGEWAVSAMSNGIPSLEVVPLHSFSPTGSPTTASPTTPLHFELDPASRNTAHEKRLHAALLSSGPHVLGPRPSARNLSQTNFKYAFLAGEAQELVLPDDSRVRPGSMPANHGHETGQSMEDSRGTRLQQDLEKRPDSSRDRLGLRASMLLTHDMTPWQVQEAKEPPPSSPTVAQTPNPKTKPHKPFGKIGK